MPLILILIYSVIHQCTLSVAHPINFNSHYLYNDQRRDMECNAISMFSAKSCHLEVPCSVQRHPAVSLVGMVLLTVRMQSGCR